MGKRKKRSWGTHNLHDEEGIPTFFADVVGFIEAIPRTVKAREQARKNKRRARLRGYKIMTCQRQRDMVVAVKRYHYKVTGQSYTLVHGGRPEVTPHRGEWAIETIERVGRLRRAKGKKVAFIYGHRINAAFPPHIRGEAPLRAAYWMKHDIISNGMIESYLAAGYEVRTGGDPNTPKTKINGKWIRAYSSLPYEVGYGEFDRLGSSERIVKHEVLSRKGSDHKRLRAVA